MIGTRLDLRLRHTLALGAALALICLTAPAADAATVVHCGQTLTNNTLVGNDLSCSGDGLRVGANSITIDLGGHTISGAGGLSSTGIDLGSHSSAEVKNGDVRHFGNGVVVGGQGNTIYRVRANDNSADGIVLQGDVNRVLRSEESSNFEYGLNVSTTTTSNFISGDVATRNAAGIELGGDQTHLHYANANHNQIAGVQASGSGIIVTHSTASYQTSALGFTSVCTHCTFTNNKASHNVVGFELFEGSVNTTVAFNQATSNQVGFSDFRTQNDTYRANKAHLNSTFGFEVISSNATKLLNNIAGSVTSLSGGTDGNGTGIRLFGSVGTILSHNSANSNKTGDGIEIPSDASATTLTGNTANRNAGDGIFDASGTATFTSNIANYNQLVGLHAAPGDTDGGGNRANHNGTGQCTNLSC